MIQKRVHAWMQTNSKDEETAGSLLIVTRAEGKKQAHHCIRDNGRTAAHKTASEMIISHSTKRRKNG
jgi:cyanophycinase-like exopeptidase